MGTQPRSIAPDEFRIMRSYIEEQCGIHLDGDKTYLVENRLTEILGEEHCRTFYDLYRKARADTTNVLRDRIIDAITTRETFWFRDDVPFVLLGSTVLDEAEAEVRAGRRAQIRIWCAGCATGQEPYSVAMTVLERHRTRAGLPAETYRILASDVSPSALVIAKAGRYNGLAMSRGLTEEMRDRYFARDGAVWVVKDRVKQMVTFLRHNLQDPFSPVGLVDVVLCRNVLIYFGDALKREVLHRIHGVLRPRGALILGSAEALSGYTTEFEFVRAAGGMFYRAN